MSRVLVTGANGFCGRHLVALLKNQGHEVHTCGPNPTREIHHLAFPNSLDSLCQAVKGAAPEAIYHLAGTSRAPDFSSFYEINTVYATKLLLALERSGFEESPVLLVGSAAEYGKILQSSLPIEESLQPQPCTHYGVSKLAQTRLGLIEANRGRPIVVVRPFNIVGPGMPEHLVAQSFAKQVSAVAQGVAEPKILVGNLEATRDFVGVGEVVDIYTRLLEDSTAHGEVVNLCSGQGTRIRSLLDRLIALAGIECEVVVDPNRLRRTEIPEHFGCTKKLKRLTGQVPEFRKDEVLKNLLDWNAQHP